MSADSFKLALPVQGCQGKDWVVNYFFAHPVVGQTGQYRDYKGGLKTYPKPGSVECRHTGTDFNVPNFRWMYRGFAVYASASGKVVCVHDGYPDINTSRRCPGGLANRVEIEHPNGFVTRYGHLKRGSISVECGQDVAAGDKIGVIGSSGKSDGPHLHFELIDKDGNVVDPCQEGLWIDPPMYDPRFSIMDFSVQTGKTNLYQTRAPATRRAELIYTDEWFTVGLFMSGLKPNEEIAIDVQVETRRCAKYWCFDEARIENFMIVSANFIFPDEHGTGLIAIYKARERVCQHQLEVQRRSER